MYFKRFIAVKLAFIGFVKNFSNIPYGLSHIKEWQFLFDKFKEIAYGHRGRGSP